MTGKNTQLSKFKQAARELDTDDSEKHFNEKRGKIAKQKPVEISAGISRYGNQPSRNNPICSRFRLLKGPLEQLKLALRIQP
jgi:hypothetical protein